MSAFSRKRRVIDPVALGRMCARACRDTPHILHFFPDPKRRERDAAALYAMRIRYGLLYGEVHTSTTAGQAIAVWVPSSRAQMTTARQIRAGGIRLYRRVGRDAVARMTRVAQHNDALRRRSVAGDHLFLSVLAVDPDHQGQGHATRLLRPTLARLDDDRLAGYLELTEPDLIAFYRRFGFAEGAPSTVPGTKLTVWPMVRSPRAAG